MQLEVKSVQFGNESLTSRVKKRAMFYLKKAEPLGSRKAFTSIGVHRYPSVVRCCPPFSKFFPEPLVNGHGGSLVEIFELREPGHRVKYSDVNRSPNVRTSDLVPKFGSNHIEGSLKIKVSNI